MSLVAPGYVLGWWTSAWVPDGWIMDVTLADLLMNRLASEIAVLIFAGSLEILFSHWFVCMLFWILHRKHCFLKKHLNISGLTNGETLFSNNSSDLYSIYPWKIIIHWEGTSDILLVSFSPQMAVFHPWVTTTVSNRKTPNHTYWFPMLQLPRRSKC